jgi:hypothetical protein
MTFEEQIAALRERHEALTMNLELMAYQTEENRKQTAEHSKQLEIDGLHIREIARLIKQTDDSVNSLARSIEAHQPAS